MKKVFFAAILFTATLSACKKEDNTNNNNNGNGNGNETPIVLTELQKKLIRWSPWRLDINCGEDICGYRTYTFSDNTLLDEYYNLGTSQTTTSVYTYELAIDTLSFGNATCKVKFVDSTQLTLCAVENGELCADYTSQH